MLWRNLRVSSQEFVIEKGKTTGMKKSNLKICFDRIIPKEVAN